MKTSGKKPSKIPAKQLIDSLSNDPDSLIYVTDPKTFEILFVNKHFKKTLGNAVGKKCYKILHGLTKPCDKCHNDKITGKNYGKAFLSEYSSSKNNRLYHCVCRGIRWSDGRTAIYSTASDITKNKQVESSLEEIKETFKQVADKSPNMIFITRVDTKQVVYTNNKTREILGYSPEEICSPKFSFVKLIAPEYLRITRHALELHIQGQEAPSYEYELISKDSRRIHSIINTKLIKYQGNTAILGIVTDISKQKQIEIELKKGLEKTKSVMYGVVSSLVMASEKRDPYVAGHQEHVAKLACAIAQEMKLSAEQVESIQVAANLHDIGKINIPNEILTKPAKLTSIEYSLVKTHSQIGFEILKMIDFPWPVAKIVQQHHEHIDGTGYPDGLSEKNILIEAKILTVADVVEAMAHRRPYRGALGLKKALDEISRNKNILYDAAVVDACLTLFKKNKFKFKK